jgi:hypothetical protein
VEQHTSDYRTVAVFGSLPDAERARGLLESDGIFAAVQDAVDPGFVPGITPCVRLLVPARDLPRARDLLAPGPVAELAPDPTPDAPPEQDRVWTVGWLALLVAAAVALLAAFAL